MFDAQEHHNHYLLDALIRGTYTMTSLLVLDRSTTFYVNH